MPRKSKKKLEELTQTDGKQETFQPTTLQQIWGDDGLGKYKTLNVIAYESEIKAMHLTDLRNHAIKIGVVPSMSRERIEKQLITKFKQHVNLYQKPANVNNVAKIPESKLEAARKIMSGVK